MSSTTKTKAPAPSPPGRRLLLQRSSPERNKEDESPPSSSKWMGSSSGGSWHYLLASILVMTFLLIQIMDEKIVQDLIDKGLGSSATKEKIPNLNQLVKDLLNADSTAVNNKNGTKVVVPAETPNNLHHPTLYDPNGDECSYWYNSSNFKGTAHRRPTTTVIVTSNLIPTMPSTDMLVDTLDSLSYIKGLEPNTPIIITVDGIQPQFDTPENRQRLMEWTYRVRHIFRCHPNIQILTSVTNQGHRKSIEVAFQQVTTEFILVMEHDFPFIKQIDHNMLVQALRRVPELQIIRFNQRQNRLKDGTDCVQNLNFGSTQFLLARWSNNNHFTTRAYYKWHLEQVAHDDVPEWGMMALAQKKSGTSDGCIKYGIHLLGKVGDGPYIHHIDGKRTLNYTRTGRYNNDDLCPIRSTDFMHAGEQQQHATDDAVLPWVRCGPNYFPTLEEKL